MAPAHSNQKVATFRITPKRPSKLQTSNDDVTSINSALKDILDNYSNTDPRSRFHILHKIYIRYFFRHKPSAAAKFLSLNEFDRLVFLDKVKKLDPRATHQLGESFVL